ncbi:hypothetical protein [Cohnella sp. 56]|uniref:hypothetical protein n=1 Tax=Cohnella sp. 56 TaxID=3113722 RepID=UPI0030E7F2BB
MTTEAQTALAATGLLGSWRAEIGWSREAESTMAERDTTPFFEAFTAQHRGT